MQGSQRCQPDLQQVAVPFNECLCCVQTEHMYPDLGRQAEESAGGMPQAVGCPPP